MEIIVRSESGRDDVICDIGIGDVAYFFDKHNRFCRMRVEEILIHFTKDEDGELCYNFEFIPEDKTYADSVWDDAIFITKEAAFKLLEDQLNDL